MPLRRENSRVKPLIRRICRSLITNLELEGIITIQPTSSSSKTTARADRAPQTYLMPNFERATLDLAIRVTPTQLNSRKSMKTTIILK
jgi:hypothetical protein